MTEVLRSCLQSIQMDSSDNRLQHQPFNSTASRKASATLPPFHTNSRPLASRRRLIKLISIGVAIWAIIIAILVDVLRTNSSARYATTKKHLYRLSQSCDNSLGRRRFWVGSVITSADYCVDHKLQQDENIEHETTSVYAKPEFSFLAVGDWGRDGMCCQNDVAVEMSTLALKTNPDFIISTGDNFYEKGIQTVNDEQIKRSWKNIYINRHESLQNIPWKLVLGNHDYLGNINAQLELNTIEKLWTLKKPGYYFDLLYNANVFIAYIDTTFLFYNETELSMFQSQQNEQYIIKQLSDLESNLQKHKNITWKLVVGHHPLYSSSDNALLEYHNQLQLRTRLLSMLQKYSVTAYISGHDHLLEHFNVDGLHTFVSGAGSKISKIAVLQSRSVFSSSTQGFLQVALMKNDPDHLVFRFFDYMGAVVHSASLAQR